LTAILLDKFLNSYKFRAVFCCPSRHIHLEEKAMSMFLKIKNVVINLDAIAAVDLNATTPRFASSASNEFDKGYETGVRIQLTTVIGGLADSEGSIEPVMYFFTGAAAKALRHYFSDDMSVEDVFEETGVSAEETIDVVAQEEDAA
jgi:hypothetical protein